KEYETLSSRVSNLAESYRVLENSYSTLRISYRRLVDGYEDWRRYVLSYLFFEDSISRVLNDSEISNLTHLVRSMVSYPSDYQLSVKELYDYVKKNVKYAYDPPVPYPPLISDFERGVYVKMTYKQIILSPSEVLSYGQGDCEDQAILLYALIRCYQRYVYGGEYILWLLDITLRDGGGHVAVAFSIGGGLTILDTASSYYTGYPSDLRSEDPYKEL
ncbi:MAG: transglutaminase-like domain-containing protein, partial [Candidatus Bathyarchaeia archaeon]